MRFLRGTLLLCAVLAASLLSGSGQSHAAATSRCAARSAESLAAIGCAGIRPVSSLQPAATYRQWRRLRSRKTKVFAAPPDCRPLRAVFYAASDWLRLATKLAANASPCAQYYISIPPLAANKTAFRADQAWRIRALGPNLHALAEIHVGGWRSWVSANNSTWYQAGVEARRRMAAAGFDVTLGDSWIVNEFPSTVISGLGPARANMRELVRGLYDGDEGPPTKGGVFDIGIGQGTLDLSTYKSQLEAWLQDGPFWSDISRHVSDWSQELYGDPRNDEIAGAPLATRRDYLTDYLRHQLVHVRLGGDATAAARAFLESADSPLANAAWQWDYGFGWTMVSADQMEGYVSAQVYALRHFSAEDGEPEDHWGFAWAPHNGTNLSAADFAAQTGDILDRLTAAIHDSGQPVDPADPGSGACGPLGQDLWCEDDLPGAWFNDAWKTFTYWGRLDLVFATPPQTLNAGTSSYAMTVQTALAGAVHATPTALDVTLGSTSSGGRFSTSPGGPWAGTLTVTIPAGGDTSPAFYYEDAQAGNPVLTASATGTDSGSQTATVVAGPVATLTVSPGSASLGAGASQQFVASGADAYGNPVPVDSATWSVAPAALGTISPDTGSSTTFTASQAGGQGSATASLGGVNGSASVTVAVPVVVPPPPPSPPQPVAPLTPPVGCVVPVLRGKTLRAARGALAHRHCALGSKRWARSGKVRRGRVLSQTPRPGAHRPRGARVNVILSLGPRRRR
jgi:hypothetical protein